jgi:excisionase family DNA binding protein
MEQQPSFYTVEDVARIMRVSEDTVRTWIKRKNNRLPSFRAGREFRIRVQDFETWLQSQQYEDKNES